MNSKDHGRTADHERVAESAGRIPRSTSETGTSAGDEPVQVIGTFWSPVVAPDQVNPPPVSRACGVLVDESA